MYQSLKGYLIFASLVVIAGFFVYSQYMVREIERETETISRIYGKFCSNAAEDETSVIFDEIITKINFPVIVTSPTGEIISSRNVKSPDSVIVARLDRNYEPVRIEYDGNVLAYVHYGDSRLKKILKFAPLAQITLGGFLLVIGIIWLYTLRKSEENALFAGISKETAHQLGTPITALMGWNELIKDAEIKNYFYEDLDRLKRIASRFHKIGSPPDFKLQLINDVLKLTIAYLRDRIPKNIKIIEEYSDLPKTKIDTELLSWAIENMIKNAVDAGSSEVIISTQSNRYHDIIIKDNGRGILPKFKRKIFSPGFTTKEYGWGVGLSLVQRIVRMHHGKIFCKPNKDGGISFIIKFKRVV